MKIFLPAAIALIATAATVFAGGQVRVVQEELRKRKVYFGNIDGRISPQLIAAIRNFQERRGLDATGTIDDATLRSLGVPETLADFSWPEGIVLRSDAAKPQAEPAAIDAADTDPVADQAQPVNEATMADFLQKYLRDAETNDLDLEMSYYAAEVDYFDHGTVGEAFIRGDVKRYYERWPKRNYELVKPVKLLKTAPLAMAVDFGVDFEVENARHRVEGRTENQFTVNVEEHPWKIVGMKEERVRR